MPFSNPLETAQDTTILDLLALRAPILAHVALELSKPQSAPHRVAAMAMAQAEADIFMDIMVTVATDTRPKSRWVSNHIH